jgi:hypothetical protein
MDGNSLIGFVELLRNHKLINGFSETSPTMRKMVVITL